MAYKKSKVTVYVKGTLIFFGWNKKKTPHKCMFTDKTFYCIYFFKMYIKINAYA